MVDMATMVIIQWLYTYIYILSIIQWLLFMDHYSMVNSGDYIMVNNTQLFILLGFLKQIQAEHLGSVSNMVVFHSVVGCSRDITHYNLYI